MNLNPFIDLISKILGLYNSILTVWVVVSLLIYFGIVNSHQPIVSKIMYFLNGLVLPVLERIRRFVPVIGGVDVSVVVLYLLITLITNILYTYFYR